MYQYECWCRYDAEAQKWPLSNSCDRSDIQHRWICHLLAPSTSRHVGCVDPTTHTSLQTWWEPAHPMPWQTQWPPQHQTPPGKHNPWIMTNHPWKHPWNHPKSPKTNHLPTATQCPGSMTFRSSQGCTAVSIDTCTALARFIGHLWRHNPMRVGVPVGFCKPLTCAWYRCGLLWKTPG